MEEQTKQVKANYQLGQHNIALSISQTKDQMESIKGQEIIRHQHYSIRKLTIKDKQKALELLVREYVDQEPLSNGFCKKFPQKKKDLQSDWTNFYGGYMDYSIANGSGVAMFDLNNNQELVGVSITRDITYFPQSFKKDILSSFNFGSAIMMMQDLIIKRTKPEQRYILKTEGLVLDIWGVAIKKEHMGKELLHRMMLANQQLGKKCGFKYGYIYACNAKSGVAGKKIGYEKIGEYDCYQLIVDGKKPFQLVDEGHRYSSIWLKKWS